VTETPVADAGTLRQDVIAFVRKASIEITSNDEKYFDEFKTTLAPGTVVYVAHIPKASLMDVVGTAVRLQAAGFRGCAHIVARRLASESDLRAALYRLREGGCDRVLLIAGDTEQPAGPFPSTLEVLESGVIADCGIKVLGVAGHPEGNPNIPEDVAWAALKAKQDYAASTGSTVHVATQFGFDALKIIQWARQLRKHGILLPVHVGLAGPAPIDKLVRYAILCGIGASLRAALTKDGLVAKLTKAARSADQVVTSLIAQSTSPDRATMVQPHFFPFGGSVETARWIRAISDGRFDLNPAATGFALK
jgi:methylenetetrahydrofolate reductase (NADPH)